MSDNDIVLYAALSQKDGERQDLNQLIIQRVIRSRKATYYQCERAVSVDEVRRLAKEAERGRAA